LGPQAEVQAAAAEQCIRPHVELMRTVNCAVHALLAFLFPPAPAASTCAHPGVHTALVVAFALLRNLYAQVSTMHAAVVHRPLAHQQGNQL
jgi:hypothetical protein